MPEPGLDARIHFLDASARLLQNVVPETSAHLMQQRNLVAEEFEKPLNKAQLKDICKACGAILVPDLTSKSQVIDPSAPISAKKRRRITRRSDEQAEQLQTECLLCCRVISTSMQSHSRKDMQEAVQLIKMAEPSNAAASEAGTSLSSSNMEEKPASANASSKKRAKARKQGGLQALLEKSKGTESKSSGLGLELMDFMKET
ncbi:MAG: hypothetical protein Q9225_004665 [Loekoesia sp. 1 TL-2023]